MKLLSTLWIIVMVTLVAHYDSTLQLITRQPNVQVRSTHAHWSF